MSDRWSQELWRGSRPVASNRVHHEPVLWRFCRRVVVGTQVRQQPIRGAAQVQGHNGYWSVVPTRMRADSWFTLGSTREAKATKTPQTAAMLTEGKPGSSEGALARRTGIEPVTPSLEGWCSIRLSYRHHRICDGRTTCPKGGDDGRGGGIRTHDLLVPNQLRYQAALRPEAADCMRRPRPCAQIKPR